MANPYDIPRSSGNTFLIFSAIAVGSSTRDANETINRYNVTWSAAE